ncbi:hypothetical protein Neosp_000715 [[Neocosmospora] mangrovei]
MVTSCGLYKLTHDVPLANQARDHGWSLYLLNNNASVEEFASRLQDTYADLGITDAPGVMRKVKAGLSKTNTIEQQDRPAVFDREGAEEALPSAEVVSIESPFLAAYALTDLALGIDTASAAYRSAKRRNVAMSLHSLAVEYFKTDIAQYVALGELVQKAIAGTELDDKDKSYMKAYLKDVYADFHQTFDGTVVTTPVVASTDLIVVGKAATIREITALIPIAFFGPKA